MYAPYCVDGCKSDTAVGRLNLCMEDVFLIVCDWHGRCGNVPNASGNVIVLDRSRLEVLYTPSLTSRPQFFHCELRCRLAKAIQLSIEASSNTRNPDTKDEMKVVVSDTTPDQGTSELRDAVSNTTPRSTKKRKRNNWPWYHGSTFAKQGVLKVESALEISVRQGAQVV